MLSLTKGAQQCGIPLSHTIKHHPEISHNYKCTQLIRRYEPSYPVRNFELLAVRAGRIADTKEGTTKLRAMSGAANEHGKQDKATAYIVRSYKQLNEQLEDLKGYNKLAA